MNATFTVNVSDLNGLEQFVFDALESCRPAANEAMGQRFYEIVQGNFGFAGVERPLAWAPLSPAYAAKVGRHVATLDLTGALRSAIMVGGSYGESVTVSVSNADVPYATVHQTGGVRMPKRPYFPIEDDGEVLPWTASQVVEAASKAFEEQLK